MKTKSYRAAGGVVLDKTGKVLLLVRDVHRNGVLVHEVRLPKGHIDEGETDEQAAIREICEESGYCCMEVLADLGWARSEYIHEDKNYVRDEHFYLMRLTSEEWRAPDVDPDSEEALFRVKWARNIAEAEQLLSYESEKIFAGRAAKENLEERT